MHNTIQVHLEVKSIISILPPMEMTACSSALLLLYNLFEHKKPFKLFTSGELEHIPPDVKKQLSKTT